MLDSPLHPTSVVMAQTNNGANLNQKQSLCSISSTSAVLSQQDNQITSEQTERAKERGVEQVVSGQNASSSGLSACTQSSDFLDKSDESRHANQQRSLSGRRLKALNESEGELSRSDDDDDAEDDGDDDALEQDEDDEDDDYDDEDEDDDDGDDEDDDIDEDEDINNDDDDEDYGEVEEELDKAEDRIANERMDAEDEDDFSGCGSDDRNQTKSSLSSRQVEDIEQQQEQEVFVATSCEH